MATMRPIAGNLMLGKPPNKIPNSKLPAMMKNKGFQAHEPTSSPVGVSTTTERLIRGKKMKFTKDANVDMAKDLNKMMAPMTAKMAPNKSGK